mmetsp:Transcript_18778/g.46978  ORF Transcript_18778/g.46978 Transcript_18778/m.46978 type:complete len:247 (+) Transcript_18778:409-1149(+)
MAEHLGDATHELGRRVLIVAHEGLHDRQHVRVAAREALPDDLEGARHDVRALNGDSHWHRHVRISHEVGLAIADACASYNVHPVRDHPAAALSARLLHDRGENHRRLVVIDDGIGQLRSREDDVRLAPSPCQRLLDPAELCDRHAELLAHARVRAHARADSARRAHRPGRERHPAPLRQALHEHVPAEAAAGLAAEHAAHRDPHILTLHSAIHERRVEWRVAGAHVESSVPALEEGDREPLRSRRS